MSLSGKQPWLVVMLMSFVVCAHAAEPLSRRVADYRIDARFDPAKKTITATEILTYRNLTGQPLSEFPFHLYLNAFQPQSTLMREVKRDSRGFEWEEKYRASIEITSFEAVGFGDLKPQLRYTAPDDGNTEDRTVAEVRLPRPVPPGEEVQFRIGFVSRLGEVFMRTGYKRDFYLVAQWFPKVGVFWNGKWNAHQFHALSEFFADFGTYEVKVTLPGNYVTGSSGAVISETRNQDGTKTITWRAEDVHDFAWTADPSFQVVEDTWQAPSGPPVKVRVLMLPAHIGQTQRYMGAVKGALRLFDQWYGPYPYDRITVVDPGGAAAGGMEYPTLFTSLTAWWMPRGVLYPEVVTVHEFGHQYWYGMVANNEFEDAWLDEGINSYAETKVMTALYGHASMMNMWGLTGSNADYQWSSYIHLPDGDPVSRYVFQTMNRNSGGVIAYEKPAMVLLTLEVLIGEDAVRNSLREFFRRYRFQHPTREDFLRTVEEVSGRDLRWYWDQAVYGTEVLDYQVRGVRSYPVQWWKGGKDGPFRTSVVVHRKGDFIFPVEVEITFDNGETVRERWDGRDRWVRFTYEKGSRVRSAEVDPEHKVYLDVDRFNNSARREANQGASRKLAFYWMLIAQFLGQVAAWVA